MSFFRRILGGSPSTAPADPAELARRLDVPAPDRRRDLRLYAFDSCPYCQRVYRTLSDLGLSVPVHNTRRDQGAMGELLELTGDTQVPCLVIDGEPLLESGDIVDWLRSYKEHGATA